MSAKRVFLLSMVVSIFSLSSFSLSASEPRSLLDGTVQAAEAGVVEIVTNSSGEVIQIRVEDCETCKRQTYLPLRSLSVSVSGKPAESGRLSGMNGKAATLTVNVDSEMVERVDFWIERGGMRTDQ